MISDTSWESCSPRDGSNTFWRQRPRAKKSNPYPSLEEKGALLACLWLSFWNEKHLKWLLVSTYLFVRCNNHKCVIDLCEEVTSVVRLWPSCLNVLWTEVVCSWLILVQVPLYLILEIPFVFLPFLPHLSLSFFNLITLFIPSYTSHTHVAHFQTQYTWRQHLHFFWLGLTRDLCNISFGSDNTIPLCLSNHVSHLFDQRS